MKGKLKKKWMEDGMRQLADELTDEFLALKDHIPQPTSGLHKRQLQMAIGKFEKRLTDAMNGEWLEGTAYQNGYEARVKEELAASE